MGSSGYGTIRSEVRTPGPSARLQSLHGSLSIWPITTLFSFCPAGSGWRKPEDLHATLFPEGLLGTFVLTLLLRICIIDIHSVLVLSRSLTQRFVRDISVSVHCSGHRRSTAGEWSTSVQISTSSDLEYTSTTMRGAGRGVNNFFGFLDPCLGQYAGRG